MITLTAKIPIGGGDNPNPFIFGESMLGYKTFGAKYSQTEYTYNQILSVSAEIMERSDISLPSYGIISNRGEISLIDKNRALLGYAEKGLLVAKTPVTIYLNDTLSKKSKVVGSFFTEKWEYDNNNLVARASIKDDLEEWQDIFIDAIYYDPRSPNGNFKTAEDIYNIFYYKTPPKYRDNMLRFRELDENTKDILQTTKIPYDFINSGTLWSSWDKLCTICSLVIHKNGSGKIICKYVG